MFHSSSSPSVVVSNQTTQRIFPSKLTKIAIRLWMTRACKVQQNASKRREAAIKLHFGIDDHVTNTSHLPPPSPALTHLAHVAPTHVSLFWSGGGGWANTLSRYNEVQHRGTEHGNFATFCILEPQLVGPTLVPQFLSHSILAFPPGLSWIMLLYGIPLSEWAFELIKWWVLQTSGHGATRHKNGQTFRSKPAANGVMINWFLREIRQI